MVEEIKNKDKMEKKKAREAKEKAQAEAGLK